MFYKDMKDKKLNKLVIDHLKQNRKQMSASSGIKYDEEKLRFDLIPAEPLMEVAKVYTHGAKKYNDRNWESGLLWHRYYGASQRHLWAFWNGEDFDKESGIHHLASAVFCCLALLEYTKTHPELDNRPSTLRKRKK